MGFIRRAAFDGAIFFLRFKDHFARRTNNRVLAAIGKMIADPADMILTSIPVNASIELPPGTVAPIGVVEHFVEEASHHVSLNFCPCRRELKCDEYPRDFGCTFIGEGSRQIDPKMGRHISKEEALDKVRKASDMGLVSTLGRFKGDALALGVKDDARLMTICHCCPCCCVTTSIHLASPELRDVLVRLEGTSVTVDDECNGCGKCARACIFQQIEIVDRKAVIGDECKGCGRCALVCKSGAVKVTVDNPAYIQETIDKISGYVDVTAP